MVASEPRSLLEINYEAYFFTGVSWLCYLACLNSFSSMLISCVSVAAAVAPGFDLM